ncbi:MAG: 3-oxoacyl-ACP reductase FabG [Xanthomonadales bacterium]|nr:3-oxoacyl-ACP reductase FabG [Xanthomonadales bacterium]
MTDWNDRVALVTGASRGIGAAILHRLGQGGAQVVGTATSDQGAAAITERLAEQGVAGVGRKLDVCDPDQVAELIRAVSADMGAPTILVNNAGITRDQLLLRLGEEDWDAIMETNLKSIYRVSKACLRGMMKARWGRIINIGSVVGTTGNPGQSNYAAAKAGMVAFSKSLAKEVGSRGITVNVVAPGFIDTDMTRELTDDQRQILLDQVPLNRLGDPADIAEAVAYLASNGAGYVTGETLHVNGGMYMS